MSQSKRLFAMALAILTAFALVLPALADVILEPRSSFYDKHRNDCTHGGYHSYAPKEGGAQIWDEPDGKVKYTVESGSFGSQWQYTDGKGIVWGYIEDYSEDGKDGWFKMSEVNRLYDHTDFENEHRSEMYENSKEYNFLSGVLYEYPNGPVKETINLNEEQPSFSSLFMRIVFDNCYKDENGREWGYIGYRFGRRNAWVCIDDPANDKLGADEIPMFDGQTGEPAGGMPVDAFLPAAADVEKESVPIDNSDATPLAIDQHGRDETAKTDPATTPNKGLIVTVVAAAAAAAGAALTLLLKKKKN